ncbi:hypothetical protein CY34DRAFT_811648 [Suillus luteus UH-Slu-Lm8-n1]|uniref:Uncharacterized protein n=1 Tax=Suillus luteus UH-Slu-Lm8-n1 TaxID=930992 RepID=A0A0D0ANZ8_9AGAM|nr:hypothetical protein CY34DRAFT_811648 [Suillus luteus UH-Slu-Lm8-n1]
MATAVWRKGHPQQSLGHANNTHTLDISHVAIGSERATIGHSRIARTKDDHSQ